MATQVISVSPEHSPSDPVLKETVTLKSRFKVESDPQHSEDMLMRKKDDFDLNRNIVDESGYCSSRALQIANFPASSKRKFRDSILTESWTLFLLFSSKVNIYQPSGI